MYLYVGSIVAIMCIYITVLLDNCPGGGGGRSRKSHKSHKSLRVGLDPETGSVGSGLGTLRRAHIDRTKVSRTSFYLRVGALGEFYTCSSLINLVCHIAYRPTAYIITRLRSMENEISHSCL